MAKQTSLFLTYRYRLQGTIFVNSDGTNSKSIATAGIDINGSNNDSNIVSINANYDDVIANSIIFSLSDSSIIYPWLVLPLPALADGQVAVSKELLLAQGNGIQLDSAGNFYFKLAIGWSILANLAQPLTAGKQLTILTSYEDF